MGSRSYDLGPATSFEVATLADAAPVLLVPLGATEQHGAHLPLNTDSVIAHAWAQATAQQLGHVALAPTMAYGSSGEHQSFAGTLSIGRAALELFLVELVRSAAHSFAAVAFLSGHGGNHGPLAQAVDQLTDEGHRVMSLGAQWEPGSVPPGFGPIDHHGGRTETSLMLYLAPELVHLDRAEPGNQEPLASLMPAMIKHGIEAVTPNGVLGDPRGASAAEGQFLFESLVARSTRQIDQTLREC